MIMLQAITDEEDPPEVVKATKAQVLRKHLERMPQDRGKQVDWMNLVIVKPKHQPEWGGAGGTGPVVDVHEYRRMPGEVLMGPETAPEPEPPPEPEMRHFFVVIKNGTPGEIAEGTYGVVGRELVVRDSDGALVKRTGLEGDALTQARRLLKEHKKGPTGFWRRLGGL